VRLGATLLGVGPIVGVAMLSVGLASHHPTSEVCSYKPDRMILVAQQAIKDRLPNLHFPIFSYSSDDHAYASNDQCNWTVIGHIETLADDGTLVRLGWAVNLRIKPGDTIGAPTVASAIVF
jgi:hypothetical protein